MKAVYGNLKTKGGVEQSDYGVRIACPGCGNVHDLPAPPFTFNLETISIGPASIKIGHCGWHGYLTNGKWSTSTDSACGKLLAAREEGRKVERKDLEVGQRVSFLRSSNKAVSLTGTIVKLYEEGVPCVEVELDDDSNVIETAHADDVTVLEE